MNCLGRYVLGVDHLTIKNVGQGEALGGGSTLHLVNDNGRPELI
jgi:hypothetical protein